MQVRIKFSADIYVDGDNLSEINRKFQAIGLWSEEAKACGAEYSETLLVEDADAHIIYL
jgi:hypothetical protein